MWISWGACYSSRSDNTSKLNTAEEEGFTKTTQQMSLSLKTLGLVCGFQWSQQCLMPWSHSNGKRKEKKKQTNKLGMSYFCSSENSQSKQHRLLCSPFITPLHFVCPTFDMGESSFIFHNLENMIFWIYIIINYNLLFFTCSVVLNLALY